MTLFFLVDTQGKAEGGAMQKARILPVAGWSVPIDR